MHTKFLSLLLLVVTFSNSLFADETLPSAKLKLMAQEIQRAKKVPASDLELFEKNSHSITLIQGERSVYADDAQRDRESRNLHIAFYLNNESTDVVHIHLGQITKEKIEKFYATAKLRETTIEHNREKLKANVMLVEDRKAFLELLAKEDLIFNSYTLGDLTLRSASKSFPPHVTPKDKTTHK